MTEEWRDIPGFEGIYQISNTKKVKSVRRRLSGGWNGGRWIKEKIMTIRKGRVTLYKNGLDYIRKVDDVHKFVWEENE